MQAAPVDCPVQVRQGLLGSIVSLESGLFLGDRKMVAIETKYIGCTNTRGSRIKAVSGNGNSITIGYPHEFSNAECHFQAAKALCEKMDWAGELIAGGTRSGYVFVFANSDRFTV